MYSLNFVEKQVSSLILESNLDRAVQVVLSRELKPGFGVAVLSEVVAGSARTVGTIFPHERGDDYIVLAFFNGRMMVCKIHEFGEKNAYSIIDSGELAHPAYAE